MMASRILFLGLTKTVLGNWQSFPDGVGTSAFIFMPYGIAVDSLGTKYVANYYGSSVRTIDTAGGNMSRSRFFIFC